MTCMKRASALEAFIAETVNDQTFSDASGEWDIQTLIDVARSPNVIDIPIEMLSHNLEASSEESADELPGSPEFVARADAADLRYPIIVISYPDGLWVADGVHRLWKARSLGHRSIRGYIISHAILGFLPKHDKRSGQGLQERSGPDGPSYVARVDQSALKRIPLGEAVRSLRICLLNEGTLQPPVTIDELTTTFDLMRDDLSRVLGPHIDVLRQTRRIDRIGSHIMLRRSAQRAVKRAEELLSAGVPSGGIEISLSSGEPRSIWGQAFPPEEFPERRDEPLEHPLDPHYIDLAPNDDWGKIHVGASLVDLLDALSSDDGWRRFSRSLANVVVHELLHREQLKKARHGSKSPFSDEAEPYAMNIVDEMIGDGHTREDFTHRSLMANSNHYRTYYGFARRSPSLMKKLWREIGRYLMDR